MSHKFAAYFVKQLYLVPLNINNILKALTALIRYLIYVMIASGNFNNIYTLIKPFCKSEYFIIWSRHIGKYHDVCI